jgi:transcriptional regulator with XRE-family HTH domain
VVPDKERRDRLAFAIRAAMGKRSAEQIAKVMDPKRSKETVARWARGETVPSALDIGPLATALGVKIDFLVRPPALPSYPLDDYLIPEEVAERQAELARAAAALAREDLEREDRRRQAVEAAHAEKRRKRPA